MNTNLIIISRVEVATNVIEYLNSYGQQIKYQYTEPDYFDDREVTVFLVNGDAVDLIVMKNFLRATYSSSSVLGMLFIRKEEAKQIEQSNLN